MSTPNAPPHLPWSDALRLVRDVSADSFDAVLRKAIVFTWHRGSRGKTHAIQEGDVREALKREDMELMGETLPRKRPRWERAPSVQAQ